MGHDPRLQTARGRAPLRAESRGPAVQAAAELGGERRVGHVGGLGECLTIAAAGATGAPASSSASYTAPPQSPKRSSATSSASPELTSNRSGANLDFLRWPMYCLYTALHEAARFSPAQSMNCPHEARVEYANWAAGWGTCACLHRRHGSRLRRGAVPGTAHNRCRPSARVVDSRHRGCQDQPPRPRSRTDRYRREHGAGRVQSPGGGGRSARRQVDGGAGGGGARPPGPRGGPQGPSATRSIRPTSTHPKGEEPTPHRLQAALNVVQVDAR